MVTSRMILGDMSTASCESKITFIDGDKGILLHRGYVIRRFSRKCRLFRGLLFIIKWRITEYTTETRICSTD